LVVVWVGVLFGQRLDDVLGTVDIVAIGSKQGLSTTTGIVVTVLTSGSTVQIDHDLDVVIACPANDSVQVFSLPLNIGFTSRNIVCPETDRYTNVVQTGGYDVLAS
jgi:hypothetical protein